jgi:hypothetical protein
MRRCEGHGGGRPVGGGSAFGAGLLPAFREPSLAKHP